VSDKRYAKIRAISPNFKRRLSGVTSTIARLVPLMQKHGVIATGLGLPASTPMMPLHHSFFIERSKWRVWHARRNTEMLFGLVLRYLFRRKFKLVFTSASQRTHSKYTKGLIARMDHVISTSHKTASYLRRPSTVILHGIDTDPFTPVDEKKALRESLGLPDGKLIGCYGRIRHQKGTDIFVDAMIDVCKRESSIYAIVMGGAIGKHRDYEMQLRHKVKDAGMSERILFKSEVSVDQMPVWYQALDLFVAPQRWEGFGLTPIEAMSCGVPVVATRVGAFEDIVHDGKTGHLVNTGDPQEMAGVILDLMQSASALANMSEAARVDILARFRLQREADEILAVYENLIGRPDWRR